MRRALSALLIAWTLAAPGCVDQPLAPEERKSYEDKGDAAKEAGDWDAAYDAYRSALVGTPKTDESYHRLDEKTHDAATQACEQHLNAAEAALARNDAIQAHHELDMARDVAREADPSLRPRIDQDSEQLDHVERARH